MIATAESLTTHNSPLTPHRPWKPDGDAHLIFYWVKMKGKTQRWVADAFRVSQPTISRVVQRYERWQTREAARLPHAERVQSQRWLTFERNELMLASCLRIADEMEGFTGVSRSTIHRPVSQPTRENEIRTQHIQIDRTGIAARFLRLAFRLNMEQLKLVELDPPPPPPPLSEEEWAEEERQIAADAAEFAAGRSQRRAQPPLDDEESAELEAGEAPAEPHAENPELAPAPDLPVEQEREHDQERQQADAPDSTLNLEPGTWNSVESPTHHSPIPVNNLHNENPSQVDASLCEPCSCARQAAKQKNPPTCINSADEYPWPGAEWSPHTAIPLTTSAPISTPPA